jgi:hypothetical protein
MCGWRGGEAQSAARKYRRKTERKKMGTPTSATGTIVHMLRPRSAYPRPTSFDAIVAPVTFGRKTVDRIDTRSEQTAEPKVFGCERSSFAASEEAAHKGRQK